MLQRGNLDATGKVNVATAGAEPGAAKAGRAGPAAMRKPPAAARDCRPQALAGRIGFEELDERVWVGVAGQPCSLDFRMGVIARNLQNAIQIAAWRLADLIQMPPVLFEIEKAGAIQARCQIVVARQHRPQDAGQIAGGFASGVRMPIQHAYPPTAHGQAFGQCATGETGADDDGFSPFLVERLERQFWTLGDTSGQHLAFAAETRFFLRNKARFDDCPPHLSGHRPSRKRGIRRGELAAAFQQRGRPHLRVFLWIEAIQIERIDAGAQFAQAGFRLAQHQRQYDFAGGEFNPMKSWKQRWPVGAQGVGDELQVFPFALQAGQVFDPKRM